MLLVSSSTCPTPGKWKGPRRGKLKEVERATYRSVRWLAFEFYNHLSHWIAVLAASGDEGIGARCFPRDDAVFFERHRPSACVWLVDVHWAQPLLKYIFLVTLLVTSKTFQLSGRLSWGELCLLMDVESYLNFKMIWMISFNKQCENFNNLIVLLLYHNRCDSFLSWMNDIMQSYNDNKWGNERWFSLVKLAVKISSWLLL